jgi:hypothetical protein
MTFTNTNKNFEYTVSLDISKDLFQVSLANNPSLSGFGKTIEEAICNLEAIA